jgi:hypothetical protein
VYAVLRLAVHGAYLAMMLYPNAGVMGGMPEWTGAEGEPMVPDDLRIYLDAASRLRSGQNLYLQQDVNQMEFYQYAPSFALAFTSFLWLPRGVVAIIHTLLHILAYALLYVGWARIFQQLGLERANTMLAWTLPVWFVFSAFWGDLGYLNIYVFMALFSTLLIEAILNRRLFWSLVWLSIILQTKPQWAFAVVVPLIMGRYRFFLKLLAMAVIVYIAIVGLTTLAMGPTYGWQQHMDYFQLLQRIQSGNYPWRGPDARFLGYNHSIKQIAVYLLGETSSVLRLATVIKLLLLMPLVVLVFRLARWFVGQADNFPPRIGLDFALLLYLAAFIWLDVVWELSLSVAVFTYLLATLKQRNEKMLVWAVFMPYALVDFWQLMSVAVFGMDVVAPGLYILTDPSIYVPLVMIVILVFYGLLIKRLWQAVPSQQAIAAGAG